MGHIRSSPKPLDEEEEYAVVVPARNMEATLAETLRSLQGQTNPPAETFLVDDGSSDKTADIAAQFGCQVLQGQSRGLGAAQNNALDLVLSDYVAFVDADDCWMPRTGETLLGALQATGVAAASLKPRLFAGDQPCEKTDVSPNLVWREISLVDLLEENVLTKSATMYRTSAVRAVGTFCEEFHAEDLDIAIRLKLDGYGIIASDAIGVSVRLRPDSMTADASKMLEGQVAVVIRRIATVYGEETARVRAGVAWRRALARSAHLGTPLRAVPDPSELGVTLRLRDDLLVRFARSPIGECLAPAWRLWRLFKPRPT